MRCRLKLTTKQSVEDGAELDFEAKFGECGGEGFAVEDPAAAVGEGCGEGGEKAEAFFIGEALDVERLHHSVVTAAGSVCR